MYYILKWEGTFATSDRIIDLKKNQIDFFEQFSSYSLIYGKFEICRG